MLSLILCSLIQATNLGFEEELSGWTSIGLGYAWSPDSEIVREGKRSVKGFGDGKLGWIHQYVDPARYRGQIVRLRGWIRSEGTSGRADLWMRWDGEKGQNGHAKLGITGTRDWTRCLLYLNVPHEAKTFCFGPSLEGKGTAWFDGLEVEIVDPDPRPLDDLSLKNLETLARVWGLVRLFHPCSTEALDATLVRSIPRIEKAVGEATLWAAIFESLWPFAGQAPSGKGEPKIVKRGDKAVLDLRGFGGDLEAHLPNLIRKPIVLPEGRSVRHFGYEGAKSHLYSRTFLDVEERRIEPSGAGLELIVVTDEFTSPRVGRSLAALRAFGVKIVGRAVGTWMGDTVTEGRATIPLASLSTPLLEPDFDGGIEEAFKILEGRPGKPASPRAADAEEFAPVPEMREVRLAAVMILWNVLHYFYPYWDVVKVDWWGVFREHLTLAAQAATARELRSVLARMTAKVKDGHGSVGVRGGDIEFTTPPILVERVEGQWVVTASKDPGVRCGAVLTKIDGRPVPERVEELSAEISSATPQYLDWQLSILLLAGAKNSEARVVVDGKEVRLKRETNAFALHDRPPVLRELEGEVGYVSLRGTTAKEVGDAIRKLRGSRGLVFDLRGYPRENGTELGWLIDKPASSPRWDIPILTHPDRSKLAWERFGDAIEPKEPKYAGKVAFLTDGRAVSQAETVMAIVKHNRFGRIFGEPTAGTNGDLARISMPGGIVVTFTGLRVTNIDGSIHHGVGVVPDVTVRRTIAGVREGRDEVLEEAVKWIREN